MSAPAAPRAVASPAVTRRPPASNAICGVLATVEVKTSRAGSRYATATVNDGAAEHAVLFAGSVCERCSGLIADGAIVAITARHSDDGKLIVTAAEPLWPGDLFGTKGVIGSCARCWRPCRRYGTGGNPLCRQCRGAPAADLPAVAEDLPGWAETGYPDECGASLGLTSNLATSGPSPEGLA